MNLITDLEKAYFAGMIDGDGCISITKSPKKVAGKTRHYHQAYIILSQSTKSYLEYWKEKIGFGSVYEKKSSSKDVIKSRLKHYQFRVPSKKACNVAEMILPYLLLKRRQAELIIELGKTMKNNGRAGISQDVLDYREALRIECCALNKSREFNL